MYTHSSDSIKESSRKRFISQAQKDRFNNYENEFIDKKDSYSKSEIDSKFKDILEPSYINDKGSNASCGYTIDGRVKDLEVYGETGQFYTVEEFIPEMSPGAIGTDNGTEFEFSERHRSDYIEVNPFDEIRFYDADTTASFVPVNITVYDKDKNYITGYNGNGISIPANAKYIRFYNATYEPRVKINKKVISFDQISSVSVDLKIKSTNRNMFDTDALYKQLKEIKGISRNETGIFFDCNTNTHIGNNIVNTGKQSILKGVFKSKTQYVVQYYRTANAGKLKPHFLITYTDGTQDKVNESATSSAKLFTSISKAGKTVSHIEFSWHTQREGGNAEIRDMYIGEYTGSSTVTFEPTTSSEINLNLPVPLEKVGNVSDRLFRREDGMWCIEKNIKTYVITENDEIRRQEALDGTYTERYFIYLPDIAHYSNNMYNHVICDKFPCYIGENYYGLDFNDRATNVYIHNTEYRMDVRRYIHETRFNTVEELRSLLVGVTVKYYTSKPEIIEVPGLTIKDLKSFENGTHVFVDGQVVPQVKCTFTTSTRAKIDDLSDRIEYVENRLSSINELDKGTSITSSANRAVTLDNTNTGFISDIRLEGRTLVNLHDNSQTFRAVVAPSIDPSKYYMIAKPGKVYFNKYEDITDYCFLSAGRVNKYLKNNTTYTIYLGEFTHIQGVTLASYNYATVIAERAQISNGRVVIRTNDRCEDILNDPSQEQEIIMYIHISQDEGVCSVGQITMVEGDHSDKDIGFFTGIQSSLDDDRYIHSQPLNLNVHTNANRTAIYYSNVGREFVKTIDIAPIFDKYGTREYIISADIKGTLETGKCRIYCQNGSTFKYYIGEQEVTVTNKFRRYSVRVTPKLNNPNINESYLSFYSHYDTGNLCEIKNISITFADTDLYDNTTDYPNIASSSNLVYIDGEGNLQDVVLRSTPDGTKDTIEKHADGKYYYHKRCNTRVIDGTETEWYLNGYNGDKFGELPMSDIDHKDLNGVLAPYVVSDKLPYGDRIVLANGNPPVGIRTTAGCRTPGNVECNGIRIKPYQKSDNVQTWTINEITDWLKDNPITIVYKMRHHLEEVYEILPINLNTYENGTFVYSNSVVPVDIIATARGHVTDVVYALRDRVFSIENLLIKQNILQNNITLKGIYSTDAATLKFSISTLSDIDVNVIDYGLYNLLHKNIVAGPENYKELNIEEMIDFYTMIGKISYDMADELFSLLDNQE